MHRTNMILKIITAEYSLVLISARAIGIDGESNKSVLFSVPRMHAFI